MKERPILFSGEMVRAILDGRKTQTRRVMKPMREIPEARAWQEETVAGVSYAEPGYWVANIPDKYGDSHSVYTGRAHCPYGIPGDRLWVREKCKYAGYSGQGLIMGEACGAWDTWAVGTKLVPDPFWDFREKYSDRWCPSIFMPRWASRVTLEITDVRVQRVQEISEEDAQTEGLDAWGMFPDLWNSINAKRGFGWEKNPWVWALTFKRVHS